MLPLRVGVGCCFSQLCSIFSIINAIPSLIYLWLYQFHTVLCYITLTGYCCTVLKVLIGELKKKVARQQQNQQKQERKMTTVCCPIQTTSCRADKISCNCSLILATWSVTLWPGLNIHSRLHALEIIASSLVILRT